MPLPPKSDPRRPLHLAVRSMRLLGIVFMVLTALSALPLFVLSRTPAQKRFLEWNVFFFAPPGLLFLLFAIFLKRRHAWAIKGGMMLTYPFIVLSFLGLMGAILSLSSDRMLGIIELAIGALLLAAFLQLAAHLNRSEAALTYVAPDEQRGFEPVPVSMMPNSPNATQSEAPGGIISLESSISTKEKS